MDGGALASQPNVSGILTTLLVGADSKISTSADFDRKLYVRVYDVTDLLQRVEDFGSVFNEARKQISHFSVPHDLSSFFVGQLNRVVPIRFDTPWIVLTHVPTTMNILATWSPIAGSG